MDTNEEISTKEAYDFKKQEKEQRREGGKKIRSTKSIVKTIVIWLIVLGIAALIVWAIASAPKTPEEEIISRNGIHFHPEISIVINGEKQEIPATIGLGAVHNPIHTHDLDGVIHLEFGGIVRENDIRLGQFFSVWKKEFSSECIFDFCNGSDGTVRMIVNTEENTEFESYIMQDGDKIEIQFE